MTFREFFNNIGDAFGKAFSFFLNMQIEDFFLGVLFLVGGAIILGILFWIITSIIDFYDSLFYTIKNPWIRVLLNYWTWVILLILFGILWISFGAENNV